MTQKELLYVEDAIGHEKSIIDLLNVSIENIEDKSLCTFLQKELKKHEDTKKCLINLLEGLANE